MYCLCYWHLSQKLTPHYSKQFKTYLLTSYDFIKGHTKVPFRLKISNFSPFSLIFGFIFFFFHLLCSSTRASSAILLYFLFHSSTLSQPLTFIVAKSRKKSKGIKASWLYFTNLWYLSYFLNQP